ncbi:MAG: hypothetical protein AABM40_03800 [Chloroflexota bacterium]
MQFSKMPSTEEKGGTVTAGSRFVRADLHVHTLLGPDEVARQSAPSVISAIAAAKQTAVAILAITDHNTTKNVRESLTYATADLLILPGIEISTQDGHLLALFAPDRVDRLEDLERNLQLQDIGGGRLRSMRSMADILQEIHEKQGMGIAAHVDGVDGLAQAQAAKVRDVLVQPGLAGVEIKKLENIDMFGRLESDPVRAAALAARRTSLPGRSLARTMASDAHSPEEVGRDTPRRLIARLRVDDLNFVAFRNALAFYPDARCRCEAQLEPQYPHLTSASFTGGFLDGVTLEFGPNLNSLIGGFGTGKSTALVSIQAALGVDIGRAIDDRPNMPDATEVRFVDGLGNERVAIRRRGEVPSDAVNGGTITFSVLRLSQDSGVEYINDDSVMTPKTRDFIDGFVELRDLAAKGADLVAGLSQNAQLLIETGPAAAQLTKLQLERAELDRSLGAAKEQRLIEAAKYAQILSRELPLRRAVEESLNEIERMTLPRPIVLEDAAKKYNVTVGERPLAFFTERIKEGIAAITRRVGEMEETVREEVRSSRKAVDEVLAEWKAKQDEYEVELAKRRKALEDAGLKFQAAEIDRLTGRLKIVEDQIRQADKSLRSHNEAIGARAELLKELRKAREDRFLRRDAVSSRLCKELNALSGAMTVTINWTRQGVIGDWGSELGKVFDLRSPRSERVASQVLPSTLADLVAAKNRAGIAALATLDEDFFAVRAEEVIEKLSPLATRLELEAMLVPDRVQLRVRLKGDAPGPGRPLNEISLGQARSVLLGLVLASPTERGPLILDQPEDHLDGAYLADAVVGYLLGAKERRQAIIATHSANLVVLGDSENVLPLELHGAKGHVVDAGSVDNRKTQIRVLQILEGGLSAFKMRAQRYGLDVTEVSLA